MDKTFVAIKPDGVKRGLIGNIIRRIEHKGYKIVGLKMLQPTLEIAEKHYAAMPNIKVNPFIRI